MRGDRPSAPVNMLTRAVPLAPCSLSLFFPSLWNKPTSTPDTPTRAPVTHSNGNNLAGARVYGEPWLAYLKASPSLSLTTTRS